MRKPPKKARAPRAGGAKVTAGALISLALGDAGCGRAGPQEAGAPVATSAVTVTIQGAPAPPVSPDPAEPPAVAPLLREHAVSYEHAARRVLYTWTTREQIEELARDRVLLTRTESPTHGPSYYDQVVAARAAARDPLAVLLRTPPFARARHAWPAAWATVLGWPGETYGDELIRVVLRRDAWIAKLRTSTSSLEVTDLDDKPVPLDEALRHPERIAAVHFMHDVPQRTRYRGTYALPGEAARPAFREYVLCNESMIESWSNGTPEIARALAAEADTIDAFRRWIARAPLVEEAVDAWNERIPRAIWPKDPGPGVSPWTVYSAAIAFPNERYIAQPSHMLALVERLRQLAPKGPPIEHRPTAIFNAAAAVPSAARPATTPAAPRPGAPPKPTPKRPRGTF